MRWASAIVLLAACSGGTPEGHPDGARGTPLTSEEVLKVFVGKPWSGPSGQYHFRQDGTYTYVSGTTSATWGPWRYTLNADGSIDGPSTTYRFYKIGPAYRYFSSETGEFYIARPE